MNILEEQVISCPYCGESIEILIDLSFGEASYIEDCQVCCRPINIDIAEDEWGKRIIRAYDENNV
ncbi:MAG: CPXCG motif-containing cysteine-rich protein [Aquificaceae bacterium]|nr:MAG: CPXCG motif-containing cysteine-rich protein [Aquificaceae bacterium]